MFLLHLQLWILYFPSHFYIGNCHLNLHVKFSTRFRLRSENINIYCMKSVGSCLTQYINNLWTLFLINIWREKPLMAKQIIKPQMIRGFTTHIAPNIDGYDEGLSNYEVVVLFGMSKVEGRMFGFPPTFYSQNKSLLRVPHKNSCIQKRCDIFSY